MRQGNIYTFIFIILISAIGALILSITSQTLKPRQTYNIEADMKKNILSAVGFKINDNCKDKLEITNEEVCCDLTECYKNNITGIIINNKGNIITSETPAERIDFKRELAKPISKRRYPVFTKKKNNIISSYCIPVIGKGLWGTIYGYIALKKDLNTIVGLSFYKHSETPGLGAEIENEWFLNNFKGKKILDKDGKLISIKVMKGKAKESSPLYDHEVDGISGATITSNAVTKILKNNLTIYEPYFNLIRKGVK